MRTFFRSPLGVSKSHVPLYMYCFQAGQLPASDILTNKDALLSRQADIPGTPRAFILPDQATELREQVSNTPSQDPKVKAVSVCHQISLLSLHLEQQVWGR